MLFQTSLDFDGACFDKKLDGKRLNTQLGKIYSVMKDGYWRTLQVIEYETGFPQASISAQLRNLRKARFGSFKINRRRSLSGDGLFEYQLEKQGR